MKTFFTATLILTIFITSKSQWYMAPEDGLSIKKIRLPEAVINNGVMSNQTNAVSIKSTIHSTMFFIGAKFGYEFNPFVIELDGKLNIDISGMVGIYSGVIIPFDKEHNFLLTPLIGMSPSHGFGAAARLQYKHFLLEVNKIANTTFYFVGVKCYVYE